MKRIFQILFAIFTILLIFSFFKILSYQSTIKEIETKLELTKDSLNNFNSAYYVDCYETSVRSKNDKYFIKLGDTMNFEVFIKTYNSKFIKKPFIVLCKKVNEDTWEPIEPYDTLVVNSISEIIKTKPSKLGVNTFCGVYYYPRNNQYFGYPFFAKYTVIDSSKSKHINGN